MVNKIYMFGAEGRFINWLVVSSSDPNKVSLTIKGILIGVVPVLMQVLTVFGVHFSFTSDNLIDVVCTAITAALTLVAAVTTLIGALRKVWYTAKGVNP